MVISLQLLTSLQFLSLFRLLKNIKDCVLDKYEWFWPRYIPLINLDLTYGVIVLSITERTGFSTTIRIITMILIFSDATYNPLERTLSRLHWAVHNFFKRNLAGASSFSNFWKQGHTTTPGAAFPTFCENCEDSLTFPVNQYRENPGDGACSLSSCSEKTRASNHLQMS